VGNERSRTVVEVQYRCSFLGKGGLRRRGRRRSEATEKKVVISDEMPRTERQDRQLNRANQIARVGWV
jgi:hypothetical protein